MKSSCAFSLTETVIALGLFAFCILPIIGLMPVGMGAVRSGAGGSGRGSSRGVPRRLAGAPHQYQCQYFFFYHQHVYQSPSASGAGFRHHVLRRRRDPEA